MKTSWFDGTSSRTVPRLAAALMVTTASLSAFAADRVVLAEHFTNTG